MNKIKKVIIGFVSTLALVAVCVTSASAYTYTRDLTVGSTGTDVVALQSFLESRGYLVMPVGVAKGYFGPITRTAVASFQAANGISPTAGYFGIITRSRVMALENATVPPVSSVPGCTPGALFSSTTGASCSGGSNVPGCFAGALYSPLTGAPCNGSSSSNNTSLHGANGTIDDVNELSQFNDEEVGEGESDVQVLGFEVKASNDGDIALRSVKVSFDPTGNTGSTRLDRYVDKVTVWQGSTRIGSADVNDFDKGDNDVYSHTITLSSQAIVRSDSKEKFYITLDGATNFDSGDLPGSWTVNVDSIRFEDGAGVISTDSNTGDIGNFDTPIRFVNFSTAADTKFRLSTSNDTPDEGVVIVDDNNDTNDVTLLRGSIKVEGTSDVLLDKFPVTLTTSNAASVSDITGSLMLTIDGEEYNESVNINSTTGVVTFNSLDLTLKAGKTYEFTVSADINNIDAPDFSEGDSIEASITSTNRDDMDVENEQGDQLSDSSEKSGTATGQEQIFRTEGIMPHFVSASTSVTTGSGSSDDLGTFRIRFTLKAVGDTIYVPSLASNALVYVVDKAGTPVGSGVSITLTNITDSSKTNVGNYQIEEGTEETFEATATVQLPTAGTAGQYRFAITGINWDTEDDSSPANTYSANLDQFMTSYIGLN